MQKNKSREEPAVKTDISRKLLRSISKLNDRLDSIDERLDEILRRSWFPTAPIREQESARPEPQQKLPPC